MNPYINIDYIKFHIKKYKLSKKNFCELCDISSKEYDKLMARDDDFDITLLIKIAQGMGVHPLCLFE